MSNLNYEKLKDKMITSHNHCYNTISCSKNLANNLLTKKDNEYILDFNKLIPMPKTVNLPGRLTEGYAVAIYFVNLNKQKQLKVKQLLKSTKCSIYGDYWAKYYLDIKTLSENKNKIKKLEKEYNENPLNSEWLSIYPSLADLGNQYIQNIQKYQVANKHEWKVLNWKIISGIFCCSVKYYEDTKQYNISFDTVWDVPLPLVKKCSELCEDGELYWSYTIVDMAGNIEEKHIITKEDGKIIDEIKIGQDLENVSEMDGNVL